MSEAEQKWGTPSFLQTRCFCGTRECSMTAHVSYFPHISHTQLKTKNRPRATSAFVKHIYLEASLKIHRMGLKVHVLKRVVFITPIGDFGETYNLCIYKIQCSSNKNNRENYFAPVSGGTCRVFYILFYLSSTCA